VASILVVDQDAGSREFIREILSDRLCIFVAGSVAEAAGLWADHAIDLAILDTDSPARQQRVIARFGLAIASRSGHH
jgi:CheY-like chemotaxis protein